MEKMSDLLVGSLITGFRCFGYIPNICIDMSRKERAACWSVIRPPSVTSRYSYSSPDETMVSKAASECLG
jgi:hypothetical protein